MKNYRSKYRKLTLYLLVLFSCIIVGYAFVTQVIKITGISHVTGTWDVRIIGFGSSTGANAENVSIPSIGDNNTSITFDVNLKAPGATAAYTIEVKNSGNINAKLDSVSGINEANSMNPIDVMFSCTAQPGDTLNAGESKNYVVEVVWGADSTTIPTGTLAKTATITLNFIQDDTPPSLP